MRHFRRRRGATVVEFAMTAPILFTLVLGAIEFSRANMLTHTASIAATEAARKSIVPGATLSDVQNAALRELAVAGITQATIATDPPTINDDTDQVTVNLTVPIGGRNGYSLAKIFLGREVFKSATLQREGKVVDVSGETVVRDGVRSTGNNGNGNGNGNANSNAGGNGNGNGNSGSGSSSSNSGNGSSSSGS